MIAIPAPRPGWAARWVLPAIGALLLFAVVFGVGRPEGSVTTYGSAFAAAQVATLAAGVALLSAGAIVLFDGAAPLLGVLAMAAALAWWGPDLVGWEGGAPLLRSFGAVLAPFLLALMAHLALAFPRGAVASRTVRVAIGALYAITAAVSVGQAAFRDPFEDPHCWMTCVDNVLLVHADRQIAAALEQFWHATVIVAGLVLAATLALRLLRAGATSRRILAPVVAPALVFAIAEAAYGLALLTTPAEDPRRAGFAAIFLVRAGAVTGVTVGVVWAIAQVHRRLAAVARLTAELGEAPAPGTLATVLARSLQDPQLQVGYWLADEGRHVDAAGRTVAPPEPGASRAATRIVRRGESVAVVVHDAALARGADLQSRIGAAARLAVDNERLQAAVLAQVEELRASRARIVATGDAERRRLERDLHDGAQQRLLALSYELRLARAVAPGVSALDHVLERAIATAAAALADLRDLAHGIYPAILADAGLGPAVASVADIASIPVELLTITTERFAQAVETTAYVATATAVDDAARRGASHAVVSIVRRQDVLVVEVTDDGRPRTGDLEELADRVGALGGALATGTADVRVRLPCA